MQEFSRRDYLKWASKSLLAGAVSPCFAADDKPDRAKPRSVAGIVSIYFKGSHADVILGKIMEGWRQDGGAGPALKLASVYIDQVTDTDIGRAICKKHGVPIFDSIEKAITLGGQSVAVDAVLSIGEHGNYPINAIGQLLYPRRRFFEEITSTMQKHDRVVPVFNDKHLGPVWSDAKWMYDKARELKMPFMAGSSMPVGYRINEIKLPVDSDIEAAVGIGYSEIEIYGFHALEFFQSHVEKRRGGERGVKSVRFLKGAEMWRAVDDGVVSKAAFDAAFAVVPKEGNPDVRQDDEAGLFLFDYIDGFRGAVFMLGCVVGTSVGIKLKGRAEPLATAFDERTEPRHPHFAYLLKAIERMVQTGNASYPVERTLLTSGILDRVLNSRHRGGRVIETPELAIAYRPVDYPNAPHVDLLAK